MSFQHMCPSCGVKWNGTHQRETCWRCDDVVSYGERMLTVSQQSVVVCELHQGGYVVADHQAKEYCYVCLLKQRLAKYQTLIARLRQTAKAQSPVDVCSGVTYNEWVVTMIDNAVGDDDAAKFGIDVGELP